MKLNIFVPTELSDITLGQYQEYIKAQESGIDDNMLSLKMLEIFCGVNFKDTRDVKVKDVKGVSEILNTLFDQKPSLITRFKIGKVQYGFIPKLDDMSFGELIDADTNIGNMEEVHKAMAVLYRPIANTYGDKYEIEEYNLQDAEIMKRMPLDAFFSAMIFFYRLGTDLGTTILSYIEEGKKENLIHHLSSQQNGDGITPYLHSLKEILQELKISLN